VGRGLSEFETFVAQRQDALLRTAYLLTQDHGHAEDLVQEAMIKLYRRGRRDGMPTYPVAYARRVLVNEYISHQRRRRSKELPTETGRMDSELVPQEPVDDRLVMWRALGSLPPRQRAVLVLRAYEGLSDPEIAEHLNCADGTVRSLAARAYAQLRQRADLLDRRIDTSGGI
jgi:RNA polymerase sigma-70 factor (sigma-E family)